METKMSVRDKEIHEEVMEEVNRKLRVISTLRKNYTNEHNPIGKIEVLDIAYSLVKHIKEEPERMNEQEDFIHKYVPHMYEVLKIYNNIRKKKGYRELEMDVLKETEKVVAGLDEEIKQSYIQFRKKDVQELEIELKRVKNYIEKEGGKDD